MSQSALFLTRSISLEDSLCVEDNCFMVTWCYNLQGGAPTVDSEKVKIATTLGPQVINSLSETLYIHVHVPQLGK